MKARVLLPSLLPFVLALSPIHAHASELDPITARYEQMLLRSPEPGPAFDRLYESFASGQGLEALEQRWQAEADKESIPHWLLLGYLAERRNHPIAARKAYAKAAELAVNDYRPWSALGKLEASQGKLKPAIVALEKALASEPPEALRADLYRSLALSQQRDLDSAAALATLQRALKDFPGDPYLLDEIATAQIEAGDFEAARSTYEQLRTQAGSDPFRKVAATIKLAQLEERQRKQPEALAIYESALAMSSETSWMHREVRNRIEQLFRRQDDLPGLVAYYSQWMEAHPKDVEVAHRLSIACRELNRKDDTIRWLSQAAEWAPDRRDLQMELARALRSAGRLEDALKLMVHLTERFPDEISYHELRGEVEWDRFQQTQHEAFRSAAFASWTHLAPATTKDPTRISRLAELLRSHKCDAEALAQYQRAVEVAPDSNDLRERLAEYLFALKRDEDAWKTLALLVEGNRATAANYQRLALLQSRYGKPEEALASIAKGLELEKNSFPLLSLKWRLLVEAKQYADALQLYTPLLEAGPAMATQIDAQQVRLLTQQGSEKVQEEISRLRAKRELASEHDLRLLTRLLLQQEKTIEATETIGQATERFPESTLLARQEAEIYRANQKTTEAVAALRRLIRLEPKQAGQILQEIARTWRQAGNYHEEIAVAKEAIELSPASADAHRLLADAYRNAGKIEDARAAFQDAVRLSDQPIPMRRQFADFELKYGDPAAARALLDDVFEAQESQEEKVIALRAMVNIYNQLGQLDSLIARFREHQKAEENGWRYALYLAVIYQVMGDATQAREELTKVLAARPTDAALLRQLIDLSQTEGNMEEVARFSAMLAESDPSPQNRIRLAMAKIAMGESDEVLEMLLGNGAEIAASPSAWIDVYRALGDHPRIDEANTLIQQALDAHQTDLAMQLELAEFFLLTRQVDKAEATLWRLLNDSAAAQVTDMAPAAPGDAHGNPRPVSSQRRIQNSRQYAYRYQEARNSQRSRRTSLRSSNTKSPEPQVLHDQALIYLAAIAIEKGTEEAFTEQLERHITGAPLQERLACFAMIGAIDRLETEMIAAAASARRGSTDLETLLSLLEYKSLEDLDKATLREVQAAILAVVTEQKPEMRANTVFAVQDVLKDLDRTEIGQALMREWLKTDEARLPQHAHRSSHRAANLGDLALVEELFAIQDENVSQRNATRCYTPLFSVYKKAGQTEKLTALLLRIYKESVLSNPVASSSIGSSNWSSRMHLYFPRPSRYLSQDELKVISSLAKQFKENPKLVDTFATELENIQPEDELQAIKHRLALASLYWNADLKEKGAERLKAVVDALPDGELALQASSVAAELNDQKGAIAYLEKVSPRQGAEYTAALQRLLQLARESNNADLIKSTLVKLSTEKLPAHEQRNLQQELRQLGLTQQAEAMEKRTTTTASLATPNDPYMPGRKMEELRNAGKKEEAVSIARAILARTPTLQSTNNAEAYNRSGAIETLRRFSELEPYTQALEKEAEEKPFTIALGLKLLDVYSNHPEKALAICDRIIKLRPDDATLQFRMAELLAQNNRSTEALPLYLSAFQKDPALLMSGGGNSLHYFGQAKRLPELADVLLKVSPQQLPQNMGSPSWFYKNLGDQLLNNDKDTNRAIAVWKKGLELSAYHSDPAMQLRQTVLQLLLEEKREDEVRAFLLSTFFPPKRSSLSINQQGSQQQDHWLLNLHYSNDGRASLPILDFMKQALELNMKEQIVEAAKERPATETSISQLIRLAEKDVTLLDELEKSPLDGPRGHYVRNLSIAAANEGASWEGAGDTPSRLLLRIIKTINAQNHWERIHLQRQLINIANAQGNKEIRITAYKDWLAAILSAPTGHLNYEDLAKQGQIMLELGMVQEAKQVYEKGMRDLASQRNHQAPSLEQLAAQIALAEGDVKDPQAIAGVAVGTGEESIVFWNISPTSISPQSNQNYNPSLSGVRTPALDGKFDLELLQLTPPNRVRRLTVIKKAASMGQWKGKLPAQNGAISARLLHKEVSFEGIWVPYDRRDNLLPSMVSPENWKIPPGTTVVEETDKLYTGSRTLLLTNSDHSERLLVSKPVPINAQSFYSFAGWLGRLENGHFNVQIRYLNAQGSEIGSNWCSLSSRGVAEWNHVNQTFSAFQQYRPGVHQIPVDTVAVEVVVRFHTGVRIGELALSKISSEEKGKP